MIYRAAFVFFISADPIQYGEVLVRDGVIRAAGAELSKTYPDEEIVDFGAAAILPGFVNAHSHLDYALSPNTSDGLNLWDWIDTVGYGAGREPAYDTVLASGVLGSVQMARSGVTCVGDSTYTGAAAEAMSAVGLRGIAYLELFGQSMGADYKNKFAAKVEGSQKLAARCSARVKTGLSPHTVYTSNLEVLELCAQACEERGTPISFHLAETSAERDYTLHGSGPIADWRRRMGREPMVTGLSPARTAANAGLLRRGVCLAHCVHLDESEVELVCSSGASVAHCARSNAYLGCGTAPVPRFVKGGAAVGIGTDSAASCLVLDFFEEMRFALGVHRSCAEDAAAFTAKDVLELATFGGAKALGLDDAVGTLEPGKRADITVVSLQRALPETEPHLSVVSRSPSDVIAVLVDGERIIWDGKPVQVDETEWLKRWERSRELGGSD